MQPAVVRVLPADCLTAALLLLTHWLVIRVCQQAVIHPVISAVRGACAVGGFSIGERQGRFCWKNFIIGEKKTVTFFFLMGNIEESVRI